MAKEPTVRTVDPANPNGPRVDAVIPRWWANELYKRAPVRFLNLECAKFVLENTQRILHGVRVFNQGGWCYTGRPESWHIRESVTAPFPADRVFAVYVNPNMTVYECRAEYVAPDDPMLPINWDDPKRYGGLLWTSASKSIS